MVKRYQRFYLPMEAYNNFKIKQKKMNAELKNIFGKEKKVPLTRIILAASKKTLFFDDGELARISSRRKKI